jgi:ligand-binding sensor domain-containing protein/signal transduction histidine kinase
MLNRFGCHAATWILFLCFALDAAAVSSPFVRSGVRYVIDSWTTDEELPRNTVTSIIQTRDGYLWFGTPNGLVRYDGFKFEVSDKSSLPGLGSSSIVRLFEDRQGGLWVGTETAGVTLIQNGVAAHVDVIQGERPLASICQDASQAVWLYMEDGQLWRHSNGRYQAFVVDGGQSSACRSIIAEASGPVWVATDRRQSAIGSVLNPASINLPIAQELAANNLSFLLASKRGGYWRLIGGRVQKWIGNRLERDYGVYRAPILAACEDMEGNLVLGTKGLGLYWYDSDGKPCWLTTEQGLPNDVVLAVCVDREDNLWVGTDGGGLTRVKKQTFEVLDLAGGLPGQPPQSVAEDSQGGLWIGFNGGGAGYWNKGVATSYGVSEGLTNSSVWSVLVDRRDRVWLGTWGGGLFQMRDGRFEAAPGFEKGSRIVPALYQDQKGLIWAGTQGGLACWDEKAWKVWTTQDGLSSDDVRAIAEDGDGSLWVGTLRGGLNRFKDGRFTSYRKKDGLSSEDVRSLHADKEGVLWIGTMENGLCRFHKGQWTRYTVRDGLRSDSIGWMAEDDQGGFWIASNMGIMRLEKRQLNDFARGDTAHVTCRTYDKSDGLPTRECTMDSQPGGCLTASGRLWTPTVKGLVSVQVSQLKPNTNPPPVRIKSIYIDGQDQLTNPLHSAPPELVIVPAGKELLEIHFSSLNLAAPGKAQFKYRLEPFDNKWKEAGNLLVASYPRLGSGRYRFEVKACNEDGVWNETGASVEFDFKPPYWRTWWFLTAGSVSLLGAIVGVVYYLSTQKLHRQVDKLKQQETLEKERSRIASDIHDQLGASLTHVAMLGELVESDKDLPEEVEAHARQITQTARDTTRILDEIVWAVNPSNDTLDSLMNYICKHAQEFLSVAGISCRLDVPSTLPQRILPPEYRHNIYLTFKESITNVVRHADASNVLVRLTLDSRSLLLEIQDDGRGLAGMDERRARTRNGLSNMRKRMEAIGGSFSLIPGPGKGTIVRLTAPLVEETL